MEKQVTIPGKAIVSLSKSHPLFQNDRVVLSDEAAELIASTVEMRLKQIVDIAKRLMNISSRPRNSNVMTPSDIRNALTSLNIPDLYGYSNNYDYRYVWSTKLYKGNRVVKRESCYKNSIGEKSWGKIRLMHIIKQDFQKPVPSSPGLTVSWAVVKSKVPKMATGMVEDYTKEYKKLTADALLKHKVNEINFVEYAEAEEKLDNLNKLAREIKVAESDLVDDLSNNYLDKALIDAIDTQIIRSKRLVRNQKLVIPRVDYVLTKEHRFFLKEIKNMVKRASFSIEPDIQNQYQKVIEMLKTSLGLDQLLPELCYLFRTETNRFKSNPSSLSLHILLQYVDALTSNRTLQIHHYVHQLLIPLLELMLSDPKDKNPTHVYRSLSLRKLAAQCIGNISYNLKRNNNGLESIDNYLMNLYKKEITNENCSLSVLYGALCGISKLPILAKRIVFYPLVPLLLYVVVKKQNKLNVYLTNNDNHKLHSFKQIILHEILHLLLEIIYDSSFDDVLSTLEETGSLMSISYEASLMVNEMLMGFVNSSVNPELLLQIYVAILNKCYTLTSATRGDTDLKRKYNQISSTDESQPEYSDESEDSEVSDSENLEDTEPEEPKTVPPEVSNLKNYYKLYNKANFKDGGHTNFLLDSHRLNNKYWYDFNGIHSLTLTI